MGYSVDIERSVDSLAYCLQKVNNEIEDISDWKVSINAGVLITEFILTLTLKERN